jgi:N-acetylmuramoyl-L-alanine amidase
MPGVLVEIGFITNVQEEVYLNSERGQTEVAMAIYKGIKAYKTDIER